MKGSPLQVEGGSHTAGGTPVSGDGRRVRQREQSFPVGLSWEVNAVSLSCKTDVI